MQLSLVITLIYPTDHEKLNLRFGGQKTDPRYDPKLGAEHRKPTDVWDASATTTPHCDPRLHTRRPKLNSLILIPRKKSHFKSLKSAICLEAFLLYIYQSLLFEAEISSF